MSRMSRRASERYGIPYGGVEVTFAWNEVALLTMLDVLREHYPSGFNDMLDHVRQGTPRVEKPEEPTGLGAVVEDAEGSRWVRIYGEALTDDYTCWKRDHLTTRHGWSEVAAVRVLSEGVTS